MHLSTLFIPTPLTRLWRQFLPGLVALVLVAGLLGLGICQSLENLVYDALFRLRGPIPWSDQVVVIEIDDRSLQALGRFPWPRDRYAQLLQVLAEAEPSVVVLDILMPEPSPEDTELAQAMQTLGRVVLAQSWDEMGSPLFPTETLQAAALGIGHVYKQEDLDGLTRRLELQKQGIPSLAVVATQAHFLLNESVPLPSPDQTFWLNWSGPSKQANHYSFLSVLKQDDISPATFRNKIVLLGVTASAMDSLQTPFDRNPPSSGVYLQATAISNLLQQNSLHRLSPGWLWLMLLLGGPGLSVVLSHWRFEQRFIAGIVLCLGCAGLGILLFQVGVWIPVATPIIMVIVTGAVVALREQVRMNALLRQSEERYALAVRGSNGGLWDWNLLTDRVYYSPRWKEMLGFQDEEIGDRLEDWYSRVHPDDLESLKAAIADHCDGKTTHFEHEHRMVHQDGTYRWMLSRGVAVQTKDGKPYRMAGSQTDITARKQVEERLWRSAYYDDLTGLPNRVFFLERLRQAIAYAQEHPLCYYAVLLLDVDRFQVVNNSLGNSVGDQLLSAIGHRLKAFLPREAILARLSGDEFAILLNSIEDVRDATRMADQVQQILALPFNLDGHEVFITLSIGIAPSSNRYLEPDHIMQDADTAMYRAKALGKARYQVFDPAMHNRMLARLKLENDLRRALANERRTAAELTDPTDDAESDRPELMLYYQPIVQIETGHITGFEALARWQHPKSGLLSPAKFISMAEETGLIIPLGWWILRQACRQMRHWQTRFPDLEPLTINVNLSSRQFTLSGLTEQIQFTLHETGLKPSSLKLELTEGTILESGKSVIDVLHQLRALGIQLAIDDFGTGYSSLNYLYRFPINTLKIDRSFITKMNIDSDSAEIVRTIVTLAHNLRMDVTAEGVETEAQSAQLLAMGCEYGQGFYYSKPLDAKAVEQVLVQEQARQNPECDAYRS